MNKTVELLDRIQELERENTLLSKRNSSLSQTVDELQQQVQQVQNPFYVPPVSFHRSPLDYVASDFWFQPADSLWNQPISQVRRNDPRFKYIDAKYPWLSTDGDFTSGYELFAAEDSPDREEENAELRKKVGELRKTIEKLNKKLETINSPLVHVVKAIKEKELNWTHLSDLKYWNTIAASTYGINAIPSSLLVDPSGKVIARDLRGAALGKKLAEIYGE